MGVVARPPPPFVNRHLPIHSVRLECMRGLFWDGEDETEGQESDIQESLKLAKISFDRGNCPRGDNIFTPPTLASRTLKKHICRNSVYCSIFTPHGHIQATVEVARMYSSSTETWISSQNVWLAAYRSSHIELPFVLRHPFAFARPIVPAMSTRGRWNEARSGKTWGTKWFVPRYL